ncbi:MAG: alpha/beta hydrolase [Polyangiaceae bacterium]
MPRLELHLGGPPETAVLAPIALALSIALALAACAPPPQGGVSAPLESHLAADVAGHAEETFRADDGLTLYAQAWRPRDAAPRAALVIVHGLRDHSGRYAGLAQALTRRGFAVYAMDLRGHGRSQGPRAHIDRFEKYVDDVSLFVSRVRALDPALPLFMLGHSMGGAIAALFAERPRPLLAGLILSAPAIDLGLDEVQACGINFLRDLDPNAPALELDMTRWSRDENVVKENLADPLVYQAPGTISTAAELVEASALALTQAPFIHAPLLVLHGSADEITRPAGSRAFLSRARSADKHLEIYEGLYHDLFHEPEHDRVITDVTRWLDERAPSPRDPWATDTETGEEVSPDDSEP